MAKINVMVAGASGRMGQEILKCLRENKNTHPMIGFSRSTTEGFEFSVQKMNQILEPKKINLVIDFSLSEVMSTSLDFAVKNKIPYLCGITGLNPDQMKALKKAAKKIPVLWSPNMSIGVAFVNKILSQYQQLEGFDFQVEEFHHNKKKDRPSGTGILLQNTLSEAVQKKLPPVLSIRGGGIYGVHKIYAMSDEEVITLEHSALNRSVFAKGAVKVGLWLVKQSAGMYSMSDFLN